MRGWSNNSKDMKSGSLDKDNSMVPKPDLDMFSFEITANL